MKFGEIVERNRQWEAQQERADRDRQMARWRQSQPARGRRDGGRRIV